MTARSRARGEYFAGGRFRLGRPPLPREHGAWVILYGPMLIGLIGASASAVPALLLFVCVSGAFLAQNALRLLLRRRGDETTGRWYAIFAAITAVALLPLLFVHRRIDLLPVALAGGLLFGIHSTLQLIPARKRLDRSQWGELLAVPGLCLTAPAAVVVATGTLPVAAWILWGACTLYFSSGIFNVKMILASGKYRQGMTWQDRWTVGRDSLIYHALLVIATTLAALFGGVPGQFLAVGYVPILIRAFAQWAMLSGKLPAFHRVGIREALLAVWFAGFAAAALHRLL